MLERINKLVLRELLAEYPDVDYFDTTDLIESMQDIYTKYKCPFIIIIDEWDCIFREYRNDHEAQERYLDFLRDMLKDRSCIYLAYMTGILPIKKYGTHSALNKQFRNEEMQRLHQQYLVSGPAEYVNDLFENMGIEDPKGSAVAFYANLFFITVYMTELKIKRKSKNSFNRC